MLYHQECNVSLIEHRFLEVDCATKNLVGQVVYYDDEGVDLDLSGDITRVSWTEVRAVKLAD